MKKTMKGFFSFVLAIATVFCMVIPAFAEDASVTYDGNAQKFILEPGSRYSPTDLFDNFKGVMPGDDLEQKISVKNDVSNKVKVKIYLRSLGAHEDSAEFLSQMNLTVTQDGDSNLFDSSSDKTGKLTDWVCLGTFYSGADVNLDVALNVPNTMDNDFQEAIGELDWQFKAEEFPVDPTDPKPPQTGDINSMPLYGIMFAGAGLMLILMFVIKRKKAEE